MIQKKEELDNFHEVRDPWGYENNPDDFKRKEILLSEIPVKDYTNVLDIGCGQGFLTNKLPGENIFGVDISGTAVEYAKQFCRKDILFRQGSIFEIDTLFDVKFDLIVITGVLYPQYIGKSSNLIYILLDKILKDDGILVSVHINEWYKMQFPYLKIKQFYYDYREYTHNLEIYCK
jgi:2-polyprenyl-3-methyl-5-hydroxy-6-metoxy-1,4-benzoquinol methylase